MCSVRIRDTTKRSSDTASVWNPSANEDKDKSVLLLHLMRMSTWTGSGDERSIMGCTQEMDRHGLITDYSLRRPSVAERQCQQKWVMMMTTGGGGGWSDLYGLARETLLITGRWSGKS
jgi:hypothetical protein